MSPVTEPPEPAVNDSSWPKSSVDRFVLAKLEEAGLRPVGDANKRTLIRRATFDLTGLPSTPAEIAAFLADDSIEAFSRVVDRLLASPAYGERWGRHWLDVVRYADTAGETADYPVREAYRYRNWVIRAVQDDKPYDQFVREQIAGDLLARSAPRGAYADLVTATGFIAISRRFGFDPENYHHLTIQDTIDTLGQAVLGLSLGCARCHDHKYDPVSMDDYYALYGIFESTKYAFPGSEEKKRPRDFVPAASPEEAESLQKDYDATLSSLRSRHKALEEDQRKLQAEFALLAARLESLKSDAESGAPAVGDDNPFLWLIQTRLFRKPVRDADGRAGIHVWRTAETTEPIVMVNSTADTVQVPGTMPPHSVAVHPPAKGGVAVAWRSPIAGEVHITGSVAHAHIECGDSTAWAIDRLSKEEAAELATGQTERAGRQEFASGTGGARLQQLSVQPGDLLQLVVLPKQNHGCDLTLVEWQISELGGEQRSWNLVRDLVPDLLAEGKGNPHADFQGRKGVWYFYQTGDDRGLTADVAGIPTDPAEVTARMAATRTALEQRARALAESTSSLSQFEMRGPYPVLYAVADGLGKNARVHKRGEPKQPGDEVPRRFLAALGGDFLPLDETGSGRRQLADWLTRPENPLTARVMVNRIWQHHFGDGLVRTENDFGERGARPTHPELLEHLAGEFQRRGWSIKAMHRLLMLSRVYQLASDDHPAAAEIDPENRLLWRFRRQRLDAESIRDSLLAIAGHLDPTMGEAHPFPAVGTWGFSQHNPFAAVYDHNRRSIYLMQQRIRRHPFLSLFDGADTNASTAHRDATTVPTQSLFLMNDPFVHEQSQRFAARLCAEHADPRQRLAAAYEATLARLPTDDEIVRTGSFLESYTGQLQAQGTPASEVEIGAWAALARTLFARNEFLFVD
ncbi:MAG: DUF1549 and DUF1553 domain-containing protein [Planctomycetales bacterium]